MKKFIRMKRRFCMCCIALMAAALILVPISVSAAEIVLSYPIYHKHIASCENIVNKTISANGPSALRTVKTDTCACGGHHDYYEFNASCSCGRTWHTTGHACINSPAGSYQGSCGNYSRIDCNTSHLHPVKTYVCGQTEDTIIDTVTVFFSTLQPAWEVEMYAEAGGILNDMSLQWENSDGDSSLKVTSNGEYHLYATYKEQDIEYVSDIVVVVNNIDLEEPNVSEISADKVEFTSDNIILFLEASDEGGLPEDYVSWDGNAYSANNYFEVEENGTYQAVVRDIAGNTVTRTITVENIDKDAPIIAEIVTNPKTWYSGNCQVMVLSEDEGSGLQEEAYSWDRGANWISQNWIEVSENSVVEVWIRDNVGNILQKEIEIKQQKKPSDNTDHYNEATSENNSEIVFEEEIEVIPKTSEAAEEIIVSSEVPEEELKYQFLPEPDWSEEVEETYIQAEPLYAEKEINELEVLEQDKNSSGLELILFLSVTGLLTLGILMCFLYLFFGICRIYEVDNRQKEKHIGNTGIRFVKKGYSVKIGENIINKANSRILKIKLPGYFVKIAEYKPIKIIVGECVLDKYIEKEINFNIKA